VHNITGDIREFSPRKSPDIPVFSPEIPGYIIIYVVFCPVILVVASFPPLNVTEIYALVDRGV